MQLLFIQTFCVTHCDAFLAVFGVASSLVISHFFLYPLMLLFTWFKHMLAHHGNKQQCADSCSIVLQICDTTLHFLTACSHYSIWLTSLPPKTCSIVMLYLACTGKHRIYAVIITVGNCILENKWRKDGEKRRRTEKYLNKPRILTLSLFPVRKISIHVHFVAVQFFAASADQNHWGFTLCLWNDGLIEYSIFLYCFCISL